MWITSGAANAPIAWRTCSLSAPCELPPRRRRRARPAVSTHVGVDALALDRVREADHRRLGHRLVRHERALDLGGAEPVPGHVQHVVDAAGDPVVAVLVAPAAVAGEVVARVLREVGLLEALVVAAHRARLARPRRRQAQRAARRRCPRAPCRRRVDDHGLDAEERQRRRARLGRRGARQRRDQDAAGLGLPPGVDDRAAALAHHVVVPAPDLGVDRLADACRGCAATCAR